MPIYPVSANLTFLYYSDLPKAIDFYERVLGLSLLVTQAYVRIYQITQHSLIGLVDGEHGTHKPSADKPVIVSFVTNEVEAWYAHLQNQNVPIKRPLQTVDRVGVRNFHALDPEGYILEFETFIDQPLNQAIRAALQLR